MANVKDGFFACSVERFVWRNAPWQLSLLTAKETSKKRWLRSNSQFLFLCRPALLDSAELGISDQIFSLIGYEAKLFRKLLDRRDLGRELGWGTKGSHRRPLTESETDPRAPPTAEKRWCCSGNWIARQSNDTGGARFTQRGKSQQRSPPLLRVRLAYPNTSNRSRWTIHTYIRSFKSDCGIRKRNPPIFK